MWTTVAAVVVLIGVQSFVQEVTSISREGDGGVLFVFEGQTYNFSSNDCSGGVLFKKPLDLDSICPHGYFLQRPKGCSSSHEIVIAGDTLLCSETGKRPIRVQAFIPLTNPGTPTEHTIALYNDPDTLQGFRRYTMKLAKANSYAGGLNGSSFMIVSNPHKIPQTSLGPLCYQGIHGAHGAAYKVHINGNLLPTNNKSLFRNGCDSMSINVNLKDAKKYTMADGFLKRFVRTNHDKFDDNINGKTNTFTEKSDASSLVDLISELREPRNVQLSSKTKNRLKISSDEPTDNKYTESHHANRKSALRRYNSKTSQDTKDKQNNENLNNQVTMKIKEGSNRMRDEFIDGHEKVRGAFPRKSGDRNSEKVVSAELESEIVYQSLQEESYPKNKRSGKTKSNKNELSSESDSEELVDNWNAIPTSNEDVERLFHKTPESDLKETIIVDDHLRFVSTYFMEMVTIGRARVTELLSGKKLSDPGVPSLFKNNKSSSLQTDWYALMKKQVNVAEAIVPETVMPRGIFQDALNAFSFMFRNLPDKQLLRNLKGILDSLSECQKWYSTNQVKVELDITSPSCPPKVSNVSETPSFLWNYETDSPRDLTGQLEDYIPNQDPIRFRHKTFPGNTNTIVQLMFTAMDIVHVACFKRFQPQVNLHSRMTYYLMSNVFLSPEVHEYWKQGDMGLNAFVSLLPNWNSGKSLQKIGDEIDMIRQELRKATVYSSWITTDPNQYSMKQINFENQAQDDITYWSSGQRQARKQVEELIKSFLYLEENKDWGGPDDNQSNQDGEEGTDELNEGQTTEDSEGVEKEPEPTDVDEPEETNTNQTKDESSSGARKRRDTGVEKLRHREIWNGLAYCLSLTEEKTGKGETIQLGIHPSLELLQSQIAC